MSEFLRGHLDKTAPMDAWPRPAPSVHGVAKLIGPTCETERCKRPPRYGVLCAACFMAASPARRAVELLEDRVAEAVNFLVPNHVPADWL